MSSPFYETGLLFSCRRCGACCRYEPGFVFLSKNDMRRLSDALGMTEWDFVSMYCRIVTTDGTRRVSLLEKKNYDCIFWENGGCTVYEARPFQCRSFPFWSNILRERTSWELHKQSCPGMGSGEMHTRREIDRWIELKQREDYGHISGEEGT